MHIIYSPCGMLQYYVILVIFVSKIYSLVNSSFECKHQFLLSLEVHWVLFHRMRCRKGVGGVCSVCLPHSLPTLFTTSRCVHVCVVHVCACVCCACVCMCVLCICVCVCVVHMCVCLCSCVYVHVHMCVCVVRDCTCV